MNPIIAGILLVTLIVGLANAQPPCVSNQFITEWIRFDWSNPADYVNHSFGVSFYNYDLLQERADVSLRISNSTTNVTVINNYTTYSTYVIYPDTKECILTKNTGVMGHCLPSNAELTGSYQVYGSLGTDEWTFWDPLNNCRVFLNIAQGTNVVGSINLLAFTSGNITTYSNQRYVNWKDTPVPSELFEIPDYCTSFARLASHESLAFLKNVFTFNLH